MKTYEVTIRIYDQKFEVEADSEEEARREVNNRMDEILNNVMPSDFEVIDTELIEDDEDD